MCSVGGIGKAVGVYGWSHPVTLVGSLLGVLLLLMVGLRLAGANLPLIVDDRAALVAIAIIGAAKVVLNAGIWLPRRG